MIQIRILLSITFAAFICSSSIAQTWSRVGTGADDTVFSLLEFDGVLSVGGSFTQLNSFYRTNHCMVREISLDNYGFLSQFTEDFNSDKNGAGNSQSTVYATEEFNKKLHIAGSFFHPSIVGNVGLGYFEHDETEDTTSFHAYSHQVPDSQSVYCMKRFNDKLFFGGDFTNLNGANFVAFINTGDYPTPTVNSAGSQLTGSVRCMAVYDNELYAGGLFAASDSDTVYQSHIAKWNGTDWDMVSNGFNGPVYALDTVNGNLVAGGAFSSSDSLEMNCIATWNSSQWTMLGAGFADSTDTVFSLGTYHDTLYAGGVLNNSGSNELQNMAIYKGGVWESLGSGINGPVYAMETYRGRLFIGGSFTKGDALVSRNIVAYSTGTKGLGMNENIQAEFNVFPNPADQETTITSATPITSIQLIDTKGQIVKTLELNQRKVTLDTSLLKSGLYFVRLHSESNTYYTERIIIAH